MTAADWGILVPAIAALLTAAAAHLRISRSKAPPK